MFHTPAKFQSPHSLNWVQNLQPLKTTVLIHTVLQKNERAEKPEVQIRGRVDSTSAIVGK